MCLRNNTNKKDDQKKHDNWEQRKAIHKNKNLTLWYSETNQRDRWF